MARPKRDGRRDNGRAPNGAAETQVLVRMSESLRDAMEIRAAEQRITVAEAWRRAGRTWVAYGALTPEDLSELEG